MTAKRYLAWVKWYVKEEPSLNLIYKISKEDFPNIGIGFPSGDGNFPAGFIFLIEKPPTPKQDSIMSDLADKGFFVMATDDWEAAKDMTLAYLKVEGTLEDPRFLPDEINLN